MEEKSTGRQVLDVALLRFIISTYLLNIQAQKEGTPVVDVDGFYTYQKYKSLIGAVKRVVPPVCPSPPLTGWRAINKDSYITVASFIPIVTSGSSQ